MTCDWPEEKHPGGLCPNQVCERRGCEVKASSKRAGKWYCVYHAMQGDKKLIRRVWG